MSDRLCNLDRGAIAHRAVETTAPPGVAGHAKLINLYQYRVLIAVIAKINQCLYLAGTFALTPQLAARA